MSSIELAPEPKSLVATRRARTTALTSGKGGVGKTFMAANLAHALAAAGERVLVLDADLGLANLDVVLNLHPKITLHDVFTGKASLEDAILPAPGGFSALLAGSGLVEYSRLTPQVRDQLSEIILPNCPPAFGQTVAERIRLKVQRRPIAVAPGVDVSVTISLGGAFAPQWVRSSATLWIERADQQLYRAKAEGRNRACLEQPTVSQVSAEERGLLFGHSLFQGIE